MEKLVYTREELIGLIAEDTEMKKTEVNKVMKSFEGLLPVLLSEATPDTGVAVKVSGVTFSSKYVDGRVGRNPQTGESVDIEAKVKPSAQFTKGFKAGLNN